MRSPVDSASQVGVLVPKVDAEVSEYEVSSSAYRTYLCQTCVPTHPVCEHNIVHLFAEG